MSSPSPSDRRPVRAAGVVLLLAVFALIAPAHAAGASSSSSAVPSAAALAAAADSPRTSVERLAGADRYATSAAVVDRVIDTPGLFRGRLLLVAGDRPLDAVAQGRAGDPILLIPRSGPMPPAVQAAYRRAAARIATLPAPRTPQLEPRGVVVVGDARTLPDAQVRRLVGTATFTRDTRDATQASAADAAETGLWGSDDSWQGVEGVQVVGTAPLAQAAAAMSVRSVGTILVPPSGPTGELSPGSLGVGPTPQFYPPFTPVGSIPPAHVAALAERIEAVAVPGRPRAEPPVAGSDRFATGALLARRAFPDGARVAYLVEGVTGSDAALATALSDGPMYLVPRCGTLPAEVRTDLARLAPHRVVAVGGAGAVCDSLLADAAAATAPAPDVRAVAITNAPDPCLVTEPGELFCWGWRTHQESRTLVTVRGGEAPAGATTRRVPTLAGSFGRPVHALYDLSADGVCGLDGDGALWCLPPPGLGRTDAAPRIVPGLASGVVSVATQGTGREYENRADRMCAVRSDGGVWCWVAGRGEPALVPGVDGAAVAFGHWWTWIVDRDGDLWAWPAQPQEGDVPQRVEQVPAGIIDVTDDAGGLLVLTQDKVVHRVGFASIDPVPVRVERVTAGLDRFLTNTYGCGINRRGALWCPSFALARGLGTGLHGERIVDATPRCALDVRGRVGCWDTSLRHGASNTGDGSASPRHEPVLVVGAPPWPESD